MLLVPRDELVIQGREYVREKRQENIIYPIFH